MSQLWVPKWNSEHERRVILRKRRNNNKKKYDEISKRTNNIYQMDEILPVFNTCAKLLRRFHKALWF